MAAPPSILFLTNTDNYLGNGTVGNPSVNIIQIDTRVTATVSNSLTQTTSLNGATTNQYVQRIYLSGTIDTLCITPTPGASAVNGQFAELHGLYKYMSAYGSISNSGRLFVLLIPETVIQYAFNAVYSLPGLNTITFSNPSVTDANVNAFNNISTPNNIVVNVYNSNSKSTQFVNMINNINGGLSNNRTINYIQTKAPVLLKYFPDRTLSGVNTYQLTRPYSNSIGTFSYTSSNTTIATVDNTTGFVTFNTTGSVTITATQEQSTWCLGNTITCNLTATAANPTINFSKYYKNYS